MIPINYKVSTTIAVEMQDNRGKTRRVRFKSGINRNYIKIRVESVRFLKKFIPVPPSVSVSEVRLILMYVSASALLKSMFDIDVPLD